MEDVAAGADHWFMRLPVLFAGDSLLETGGGGEGASGSATSWTAFVGGWLHATAGELCVS